MFGKKKLVRTNEVIGYSMNQTHDLKKKKQRLNRVIG